MIALRRLLPLASALLCAAASLTPVGAQQPSGTITGQVIDSATRLPLVGVNVVVEGTGLAAITREDGTFTIVGVPAGTHTLRARRIGYGSVPVVVNVSEGATVSVTLALEKGAAVLDEIVVVGYTTQRRANITGAVATVDMADVETRRVPDVAQVLQGQVAGLTVTQSTGAPGEEISIRIRGEGTIGNNSPLFIVDGVPSREIAFLNPADVQSMTVLKDASAAAIYGSRASAGVIVITTKHGASGKSTVDLNSYAGIQRATNLPTMLNGTQYMNKMEEAWNNSGFTGTNPYTVDKSRTGLANTDWLHALFTTGRAQDVQLTASGGTDKVQYLLSGGLNQQDGIVVYANDKYQRVDFERSVQHWNQPPVFLYRAGQAFLKGRCTGHYPSRPDQASRHTCLQGSQ